MDRKRQTPIMCVIGNPPYNPSSKNNNPWIAKLMASYKEGITDKKSNLNDDYMKFIRLAEAYITKAGVGVVAMITNNSFLDGTTQRSMRSHLLSTFDKIDVYNLHGDIRAKQSVEADENVFDITQGVAITVMRRTGAKTPPKVRYVDVLGRRDEKQARLSDEHDLNAELTEITPHAPYYFFVPKAFKERGRDFSLADFFEVKSSGIQTKNDAVAVSWTQDERNAVVQDFLDLPLDKLVTKYPPMKVWDTAAAQTDLQTGSYLPRSISYRPFDKRHTVLTEKSSGFLGRPRFAVMQHIGEDDLVMVVNKKHVGDYFSHVCATTSLVAHGMLYLGNRGQDYACPLYLAADSLDADRRINFAPQLYAEMQTLAKHPTHGTPDEVAVFDYIYGVLHCPAYRKAYAEFLKIDFPRIPWPATPDEFWEVSSKGTQLRKLHLMDPATIGPTPYPFKGEGNAVVDKPRFEDGKVWINATQYFDNAPEVSWTFYIGGYQPAQKWLKDRKGRALNLDDVKHYRNILTILAETDRIMRTIKMTLEAGASA